MLCRFLWFGFDVELASKANGFLMVHRQVEEPPQMVHLALELGVQKSAIALSSAPEHVTGALKGVGHLDGLFDLGCGVRENVGVATGGGAVREARMGKQT